MDWEAVNTHVVLLGECGEGQGEPHTPRSDHARAAREARLARFGVRSGEHQGLWRLGYLFRRGEGTKWQAEVRVSVSRGIEAGEARRGDPDVPLLGVPRWATTNTRLLQRAGASRSARPRAPAGNTGLDRLHVRCQERRDISSPGPSCGCI
ncbi:hypothetical protein GGTG_09341 [Gaeumannomyces tritici R3-111a-1]|uniref:Uncharacterized protein n=1 Tax=Gaeumannomyces tritici (strain R3-111a-1) TaxID=644352 RepID=J3P744_GAET3|nr:hypothetical protein GGTG_09341 [Gaeumannomyces tritici R3-111a-1]EJT72475.1 hypothetical protein GGTG_09341 [Gaeumannomyces tritici R3-111a-1]